MKKKNNAIAILIASVMLAGLILCMPACKTENKLNVNSDTLYVKKVDNLSSDFIMGMDASAVPSLEKSGVKYYDFNGEEKDVFQILAENGVNTIRVRVWNNPYDDDGNGFGGGNCDIENALEIGKRATKYGMGLMVNFHYSDFWADPSKQMTPRAWKGMTIEEKSQAVYDFTLDCMRKLKDGGVKVTMVQVGNETNNSMSGETSWMKIASMMNAGSKAVRETYPDALVAVHFANPEKVDNYKKYAYYLASQNVDYDVFASSYYPYWHGTLENLSSILSFVASTYNKKVMVAETSYAFTEDDSDFFSNTIGAGGGVTKNYPFTVQGQSNSVRDIIDTVAHVKNTKDGSYCGIGVCYWEGTWISVGTSSYEENFEKWEKYGSGWASSYAGVYDASDAGKWYGGCAVDNQAFFDAQGKPLESLKVFALAGKGNEIEPVVDAAEDVTLIIDLNGEIKLPEKVNAVMTDDSKKPIDVTWNIDQAKYDEMYSGGVAKYDITGVAGGMPVHCYVSMVEYNFINNYSFEDDSNKTSVPTGWTVINNNTTAYELYVA